MQFLAQTGCDSVPPERFVFEGLYSIGISGQTHSEVVYEKSAPEYKCLDRIDLVFGTAYEISQLPECIEVRNVVICEFGQIPGDFTRQEFGALS